jgi:hypothetical protein
MGSRSERPASALAESFAGVGAAVARDRRYAGIVPERYRSIVGLKVS